MSDQPNPYEAPNATGRPVVTAIPAQVTGLTAADKRGIVGVTLGGALGAAIDYGFFVSNQFGFMLVIMPAAVFLVVTTWIFAALSRGRLSLIRRLSAGFLLSLVTVPACYACLFFTCAPATALVGVGWDLRGSTRYNFLEAIIGGSITFVCIAAIPSIALLIASRKKKNVMR